MVSKMSIFMTKCARKSRNSSIQRTKIPFYIVIAKVKEKVEIQKQLKKNIGQSKLSNHKLRVVDTFQKRMNLADGENTKRGALLHGVPYGVGLRVLCSPWLTLRSNRNRRSLSNRSVGSRKRLSPGMISFAARTFA